MHVEAGSRVVPPIWYVYPLWKKISFTLASKQHIRHLRPHVHVEEIDEDAIAYTHITCNPIVLMHPYFYPMERHHERIARRLPHMRALIGLDVADTDALSWRAVELANMATAMIVPSNFSRRVYESSGVRVPVHVLPHGVGDEYFETPRSPNPSPQAVASLRKSRGIKMLLSYVLHSDYRKGLDILMTLYEMLRKERGDVALVIRDAGGLKLIHDGEKGIFSGWMTEKMKIELFDSADLFVLASRGGGFELPGLEALARGVPAIAAKGGSWEDYMPEWGLVPSRPSNRIFEGNTIHVGKGVEMILEKAVDRALEILDNLDDYSARAQEYAETRIRKEFTWRVIAERLLEIIWRYS